MSKAKLINVSIPTTDLAPLCGMDHYDNFAKVVCKIWKKLEPHSYNEYKVKCYKNGDYVANDSMKQKMLVLNNKLTGNTFKINSEISKINRKRNTTTELNESQDELINKMNNVINSKKAHITDEKQKQEIHRQQAELEKLVKSSTNVVYGTKNEYSGYDYFEKTMGQKIKKRQQGLKEMISENTVLINDDELMIRWSITGVADGLTVNDHIIEIKNRQKRLFNTVRDYEMCQIQTYMYVLRKDTAFLVELMTDKAKNVTGNVLTVDKQPQYFYNIVYPHLNKLIAFMMLLFYPDDRQVDNYFTDDERESICMELIRGDTNKFVYNMVYS